MIDRYRENEREGYSYQPASYIQMNSTFGYIRLNRDFVNKIRYDQVSRKLSE